MKRLTLVLLAALAASAPGYVAGADVDVAPAAATSPESPPITRNGRDIFAAFLAGRADSGCDSQHSNPRWERHFSHAPSKLANRNDDVLPLFGYVVDQLTQAGLPTEFALIPFVESGYRPSARNGNGPAGLWQFVTSTARNHHVSVNSSYDGRLSAVDSTTAAVRYLKTLYGMFGGDWRMATMAYNAGENRILQSMRRAGLNTSNARPADLAGLSPVTYSYVEKLHALACVLDHAQGNADLMASLDRPVPILTEHALPSGTSLNAWANERALEPELLKWLNPALANTAISRASSKQILAPMLGSEPMPGNGLSMSSDRLGSASATDTIAASDAGSEGTAANASVVRTRTHTVRRGESAWSIARRYGLTVKTLLTRNGLNHSSILKPGMVLAFDEHP